MWYGKGAFGGIWKLLGGARPRRSRGGTPKPQRRGETVEIRPWNEHVIRARLPGRARYAAGLRRARGARAAAQGDWSAEHGAWNTERGTPNQRSPLPGFRLTKTQPGKAARKLRQTAGSQRIPSAAGETGRKQTRPGEPRATRNSRRRRCRPQSAQQRRRSLPGRTPRNVAGAGNLAPARRPVPAMNAATRALISGPCAARRRAARASQSARYRAKPRRRESIQNVHVHSTESPCRDRRPARPTEAPASCTGTPAARSVWPDRP